MTPCLPCKKARFGCWTGGLSATQYHKKMVDEKLLTYASDDEYLDTRKLKPEILAKYKSFQRPGKPGKASESKQNLIGLT